MIRFYEGTLNTTIADGLESGERVRLIEKRGSYCTYCDSCCNWTVLESQLDDLVELTVVDQNICTETQPSESKRDEDFSFLSQFSKITLEK